MQTTQYGWCTISDLPNRAALTDNTAGGASSLNRYLFFIDLSILDTLNKLLRYRFCRSRGVNAAAVVFKDCESFLNISDFISRIVWLRG